LSLYYVDILSEVEPFFPRHSIAGGRLIAPSPFRYDRHASFSLDVERGYWNDSGANDPEWEKGGIVRLLAFLRNETISETLEYLRIKYGGPDEALYDEDITLDMPLLTVGGSAKRALDPSVLDAYRFRHTYLSGRGISEPIQRLCNIGYDRERKAVTIPIYNADGSLGNVKYRRTDSKVFWYAGKGGRPIREMLFGIDIVHRRKVRRAALLEAEICAMTVMTAGMAAVATMGAAFTREKADLIRRSPIEELVLIRDQDAAGRKWQRSIIEELGGDVRLSIATVCRPYKDPNEAGVEQILTYIKRARRMPPLKFTI